MISHWLKVIRKSWSHDVDSGEEYSCSFITHNADLFWPAKSVCHTDISPMTRCWSLLIKVHNCYSSWQCSTAIKGTLELAKIQKNNDMNSYSTLSVNYSFDNERRKCTLQVKHKKKHKQNQMIFYRLCWSVKRKQQVHTGLGCHDIEWFMSTRSGHLDAGLISAFYFPLYNKA